MPLPQTVCDTDDEEEVMTTEDDEDPATDTHWQLWQVLADVQEANPGSPHCSPASAMPLPQMAGSDEEEWELEEEEALEEATPPLHWQFAPQLAPSVQWFTETDILSAKFPVNPPMAPCVTMKSLDPLPSRSATATP
jgi:hypothetical protein